jgi:hypothetical protein
MHIQWKISHWTQSIYNQRPNSDIWHEASIHDIYVNPVTSSDLHSFHLVIVKQDGIMRGNTHCPFDGAKKGVRQFEQKTEVLPHAGALATYNQRTSKLFL